MAGTIKGIIVEIGGDTSNLQKALNKVNSQSSSLSKELKGINSLLKLDPKNVELLGQKQVVLNENIEATQKKLNQLKQIKEEADKKMAKGTKVSEENYRNLQREIINTERKLNNLTNDLKQFMLENSNWTKAGKKIEEYGDKVIKVGKKVDDLGNKASIVSGAVVAGGTVLTNNAMNLEDAISKYVSTTNTAQEETEKYKQVLENIHRNNYGESYEDIANSMSSIKMQLKDINSQDLQNITEKAIAFRDLFGYEVSESVRAVKALMDNFNISADEAFNLLTEGKKQGLDFSNELLDNVNEYSVQFKKLGLTADDMFNIFKSGAENGAFNLDKIGDAVKEFSIRAIDGSNTTIEGFKKLGLNANTMAKKFAQGGDVAKQAFIEVVEKIGKMDNKVEQSIVGVDLFGTMWEDLGPTVVTSFSKMDNGISKSSNSMQESIDGLYNTTKKKAEAQLRRLQSLGADFGKEMLPVLEKIIDKAEDFIKCLEGMSDAEKENILKMGLFVAGIGPATKVLGTAGKVIGTTTKGIGTFSQAVGLMGKTSTDAFNNASKGTQNLAKGLTAITSPAGLATTAITILAVAIGTKLYEETKKAGEGMQSVADSMSDFVSGITNAEGYLDKFDNTLFSSTESQKELEAEMSKIQSGITSICKTASDERRGYTQEEINQLNQYFDKMQKIQEQQMQIQEEKTKVLIDTARTESNSFQGSFGEYKELSQKWIKTIEEQTNKQKSAAEEYRVSAIANLNSLYSETERIDNEEYARKVQVIQDEYNKRISMANGHLAEVTQIYSTGATEKMKIDEGFRSQLETFSQNVEAAENQHAENIKKIKENTRGNIITQHQLLQGEELAHKIVMSNLWKQMNENMTESQRDQLGSWTMMLADAELYGNKIEEEDKSIVDNILKTWSYMPNDTRKAMKYAMQPMLEEMENKAPQLFAKAIEIGDGICQRLKKAFDERSPSKRTRKIFKYAMEGAELGLEDESKSLYKQTDRIAQQVIDKFNNINLSSNITKLQPNISKKVIDSTRTIFTTPQIVFNVQELDEAKLQQCFNFVNRKFGSQY